MTRNPKYNVRYITYFLKTPIDFLAQRSAHLIMVVLTCVRVPLEELASNKRNNTTYFLCDNLLYNLCVLYLLLLQVDALLKTLDLQESALHNGPFALFNCLVIGNTKFKGVQRVYCNQFPVKQFYGSHRLDLVMIRPPGIDNGAFVVLPNSVWYARVLLLFSACAMTDTGSKSFECALVSTLERTLAPSPSNVPSSPPWKPNDPDNGNYEYYIYYIH